jgi:porin
MVHMKHTILLLQVIDILLSVDGYSQSDTNSTQNEWNPFTCEGSYVGDAFNNLKGGLKTGSGYLGMGNFRIALDTKKAGWWDGGIIFINAAATHGKSPSEMVGDFQVVSNIDAGDHMFIQELWYKQAFGKCDLVLGLQDMNAEFLTSEGGGQFMNSSFGVPSVISDNIPAPIFPLTTLGIEGKWNITNNVVWQIALFDGNPTDFSKNTYNLDWQIKKQDGALAITEVQIIKSIWNKPTTFKAGIYYHSALKQFNDSLGSYSKIFTDNKGFYGILDQNVWHNSDSTKLLNYFIQCAYSPRQNNTHNYYIGGGITFQGFFNRRQNDIIGLAFANAGFHNYLHKHETAIEMSYKFVLNKNIYIQPNLQYLMSPSGTDSKLDDAVIGFVRFGLNF